MLHAALDLAPHGILIVEEGRVGEADEELAVGAVGVARPGHRGDSADVRLLGEFRLEVAELGAAHAGPGRVAALRHEAGNHAVEGDAVVKAALGQRRDALDMVGRQVGPQLDDDVAAAGKGEGQAFGVGHVGLRLVNG